MLEQGGDNMPIMTAEEVAAHTENIYKFVRVNSVFRFCELAIYGLQHRDMVKDGEKATAAGSFFVYREQKDRPNEWKMSSPYSQTLNLGCSAQDETDLGVELARVGFFPKEGRGLYD
jgi:hypothetical protein